MKKMIGWILIILGGFFCFNFLTCIPAAFTADGMTWGKRILVLVYSTVFAFAGGMICRKGFKIKAEKTKRNISHVKPPMPAAKPTMAKKKAGPMLGQQTGVWKNTKELRWPSEIQKSVKTELLLPKTLFVSYESSSMDEYDNVHYCTQKIIMENGGKLVRESSSITYSAHSLAHNTGRHGINEEITFEELDALIEHSENPEAKKYRGMNAENWRTYVETPCESADLSKYPVLLFGRYAQKSYQIMKRHIQWYVLSIDEKKTALLLAEQGLVESPWNNNADVVKWEESYLYRWLNETFVQKAFAMTEQRALEQLDEYGAKVTLLSQAEVNAYLKYDGALCATPTELAQEQGAFRYPYSDSASQYRKYDGNGLWWLRSTFIDPNNGNAYANAVYWDGDFCNYMPNFTECMVRPVICLNVEKAFGKKNAELLCEEYWSKMKSAQ